jgi:hypothetical protein
LLNIDESRGLTLPSQNQHNFNQHANTARQHFHHHSSRPSPQRNFSPRQQQALSSILRPLNQQNNSNRPNNRPPNRYQCNQFPTPNRSNINQLDRRNAPPLRPHHGTRPPQRPMSANSSNQRRPQNSATPLRRNTLTNATNIVCINCGRIGHYARQCPTANRSLNNNRNGNHLRTTANNENTAPQNQLAYFVTNALPSTTPATHYHQALCASSENPVYNNGTPTIWPDTDLPQMEINQSLLDQDFALTTSHAPPSSDANDFIPDDPNSAYQRFGPPRP